MASNSKNAKRASAHASPSLSGRIRAPGDKSISHRSLILGALANGTTEITGLLEGDDILHTAEAMRRFGAEVTRQVENDQPVWTVKGAAWTTPDDAIDFGNAGTGARLVMGAAASFPINPKFIGDESLSARPMGRVLNPLRQMGADYKTKTDKLPLSQTKGGGLNPISFTPPHASAQVKSAILLENRSH